MAVKDGGILIPVSLDLKGFHKEVKSLQKDAKAEGGKAGSDFSTGFSKGLSFKGVIGDIRTFNEGIKMSRERFKEVCSDATKTLEKVKSLKQAQEELKAEFTLSDEYLETEKAIQECLERLGELRRLGASDNLLQGQIQQIDKLNQKLADLAEHGTEKQQKDMARLKAKTAEATIELGVYDHLLKHLGRGQKVKALFGGLFNLGKKGLGGLLKISWKLFKGFGKGVLSGLIGGFRRLFSIVNNGVTRLLAMVGIVALVRKGFQNLIESDKETANSVKQLKNSLTALGNALASCFAPIINTVAPILSKFIGMLTRAANAVASFISALLGKKFAVVASGVSDGLDGIGDSASGANDSAEELKRTLMGFDKINKLDGENAGGGGGSGGGGGGGGGGGFDLVPVSDEANAWAEKFKESWEKADFEWLGTLLGEKIRDGLNKIPWDDIQEVAEKLALSITSFLKGLFEVEGLGEALGHTLAQALNTAIVFCETLVETFPWEQLGQLMADTFNQFLKETNWTGIGKTIGGAIIGVLKTLNKFISNTDWEAVGKAIVDMIAGVDWGELFDQAGNMLANIANAIYGVLKGACKEAKKKIGEWLEDNDILDALPDSKELLIKCEFFNDLPPWMQKIVEFAVNNSPMTLSLNVVGSIAQTIQDIKDFFGGTLDKERYEMTIVAKFVAGLGETFQKIYQWLTGDVLDTNLVVNVKGSITDIAQNALPNDKKVIGGMTGNITDKKDGIPSNKKGLGGFLATLTDQKDGISKKKKVIGKQTAKLAYQKDGISSKKKFLSGFNAGLDYRSDNLTTNQKILYNFTAVIDDYRDGIHVKGGTITKALGGLFKNGKWSPIQNYASGGMPSGSQLFWARERGPELVGTLNGHTAVMNNDQIVASVSSGVARAIAGIRFKMVAPKLANAGSSSVGSTQNPVDASNEQMVVLLTQILKALNEKNVDVVLDGESIKNNVVRRINNHTRATGQLELLI